MEYSEAKEFLKHSLLYQMSLGSKELYHSNVWAWLIEQDNHFIEAFDKSIYSEYEIVRVSRESQNRDIIVWLNKTTSANKVEKYYYSIENKIKTLPDFQQLHKYTRHINDNKLLRGTLVALKNTIGLPQTITNDGVSAQWGYIGYSELALSIKDIATKSSAPVIQKCLGQILEYCDIVEAISIVLSHELKNHDGKLSYLTSLKNDSSRLHDVYVKLKGSEFVDTINKDKDKLQKICPSDFYLCIAQGFNNCKATIDVKFTNWTKDRTDFFTIGIQIEEKQYRRFVNTDAKSYSVEQLFSVFEQSWFDSNSGEQSNGDFDRAATMRKKYNCYGAKSNSYSFVYQYSDINDDNNDYSSLVNRVLNDMEKAAQIINSRSPN